MVIWREAGGLSRRRLLARRVRSAVVTNHRQHALRACWRRLTRRGGLREQSWRVAVAGGGVQTVTENEGEMEREVNRSEVAVELMVEGADGDEAGRRRRRVRRS